MPLLGMTSYTCRGGGGEGVCLSAKLIATDITRLKYIHKCIDYCINILKSIKASLTDLTITEVLAVLLNRAL